MKPRPKKLTQKELDKIVDTHCVYDSLDTREDVFYFQTRDFKKLFGHIFALEQEVKAG